MTTFGRFAIDQDTLNRLEADQALLALREGSAAWSLRTNGESSQWALSAANREGIRRGVECLQAYLPPGTASIGLASAATSVGAIDVPLIVTDAAVFLERVELMIAVRLKRPERLRASVTGVHILLRDFRLALRGDDIAAAEEMHDRLRLDGRLSADNLDFLRIELLGRAERWKELRALDNFLSFARSPLPSLIREYMVCSIWWADLVAGQHDSPGEAARAFGALPEGLRPLFDRLVAPTVPAAIRIVALRAHQQEAFRRIEALAAGSETVLGAWLRGLLPTTATGADSEHGPDYLLREGRYFEALDVSLGMTNSAEAMRVAVEAAYELDSAMAARRVLQALTPNVREFLPTSRRFAATLRQLEDQAAMEDGWLSWMAAVAQAGVREADRLAAVARTEASLWATNVFVDPHQAEAFAEYLGVAMSGPGGMAVEQSADLLCGLATELVATVGAGQLVDAVLTMLVLQQPTAMLARAIVDVVRAALSAWPSARRYSDLLDVCAANASIFNARSMAASSLELLDELAAHPAVDGPKRSEICFKLLDGLHQQRVRGQLDDASATLAELLSEELGLSFSTWHGPAASQSFGANEPVTTDMWAGLSGRRVVIYSMLEGLGSRVRAKLFALCPTTKVDVLSEPDASDRLRQVVQAADFLVVDTWHAKHAATQAIGEAALVPILRPEGRGATSILQCLAGAMSGLVSAG